MWAGGAGAGAGAGAWQLGAGGAVGCGAWILAWNWSGISSHTLMKMQFKAKFTQFLFILLLGVQGLGF